jgi:hypothetical protein
MAGRFSKSERLLMNSCFFFLRYFRFLYFPEELNQLSDIRREISENFGINNIFHKKGRALSRLMEWAKKIITMSPVRTITESTIFTPA